MLNENIKTQRKAKGLSQEEFAQKLCVVRQTVSKWEQGLSVPDADMLIRVSEVLETPVSDLLGENITPRESSADTSEEIKAIAEKLQDINLTLARAKEAKRKRWNWVFIILTALIVIAWVFLIIAQSPYLAWDMTDPEIAVAATLFHAFEFVFGRLSPFALIGCVVGIVLTLRRRGC